MEKGAKRVSKRAAVNDPIEHPISALRKKLSSKLH
jgi:hypothetical protein